MGERFGGLKFYAYLCREFGRIPEWPNGADCKSAGFYLRWFESITSHSRKPVGVAGPSEAELSAPRKGSRSDTVYFCEYDYMPESPQGERLRMRRAYFAEVAQLIEHQPSKLRVASLSLVFRSETNASDSGFPAGDGGNGDVAARSAKRT